MALRLYWPSTTDESAPIAPAFGSGWENIAGALRGAARATRDPAASAGTIIAGTGVAGQDVLHRQLVIGPFAAQTISGTFRMVVRSREDAATIDARAQLTLRAFDLAGAGAPAGISANLIDFDTAALSVEFTAGFSVSRFPRNYPAGGTAISGTPTQPFYYVVEYGHRNHGTSTSTVRLLASGSVGSDLSETEGDATAGDAWLEFSQDLLPYVAATPRSFGVVV